MNRNEDHIMYIIDNKIFVINKYFLVNSVKECYIGVEDIYANPRTLSFPDLSEVINMIEM